MSLEARELLDKIQTAHRNGNFREEHFKEAICYVLDQNEVEYETEHAFKDFSGRAGSARRCDIYIPETDTAIELKLEASMRGVGQCIYYTRFCREALLLSDGDPMQSGHNGAVQAAAEVASGVSYALCTPGVGERPPVLDIRSDDTNEFFYQARYGDLGSRDFVIVNGLGSPSGYSGVGSSAGENAVNARGKRGDCE